jgi:hypothetical protein
MQRDQSIGMARRITGPYSFTTEYSKYKRRDLDDEVTTADLFDLLDLDDELRKYWKARWDAYHDDQHMELPTPEIVPPLHSSNSDKEDDDDDDPRGDNPDDDDDPKRQGNGKGTGRPSRSPATPKGKEKAQSSDSSNGKGKTSGADTESATGVQSPDSETKSPEGQNQKRKRSKIPTTSPGSSTKRTRRSVRHLKT